jgi:isopenicillin N synthase-like dioxygenase
LLLHVRNTETDAAESFFRDLLKNCGIEKLPEDWRDRVRIGSDRQQSGTARENLVGGGDVEVPDELTDLQKDLVEYAAPGLRKILGYE